MKKIVSFSFLNVPELETYRNLLNLEVSNDCKEVLFEMYFSGTFRVSCIDILKKQEFLQVELFFNYFLTHFYLDSMTDLSVFQLFSDVSFCNLQINFDESMSNDYVTTMFKTLCQSSVINTLTLNAVCYDSCLHSILEHHHVRHLSSLKFFSCHLSNRGFKVLTKALSNGGVLKFLKELVFENHDISPISATYLSIMLKDNQSLKRLSLSDTSLVGLSITMLADALAVNETLTCLELLGHYLNEDLMTRLFNMLNKNKSLLSLNLSDSKISLSALTFFLDCLTRSDKVLNQLNLSGLSDCYHYESSCEFVKKVINMTEKQQLTYLNLSGDYIEGNEAQFSQDACRIIKDVFSLNCLRELSLASLGLYDQDVLTLLQGFTNTHLISLCLSLNYITEIGASYLDTAFQHTSSLRSLDMSYNSFSPEGVAVLFNLLKIGLKSLSVGYMPINNTVIKHVIGPKLSENKTLVWLYMGSDDSSDGEFNSTGMRCLRDFIFTNQSLEHIDIEYDPNLTDSSVMTQLYHDMRAWIKCRDLDHTNIHAQKKLRVE